LGFYETSKQHKEMGDEGHTNKTTIKEMAKEERGMQKEENPEKKQTREQEEKRETTWRTLRAFSLENKQELKSSSLRMRCYKTHFKMQNQKTIIIHQQANHWFNFEDPILVLKRLIMGTVWATMC
jgi:hypothetical protein